MWRNSLSKTYFYVRPLKFYNISEMGFGTVDPAKKGYWASNGNSILIGPEILGGWYE